VVLSFDADALDRFWLAEYAPELIQAEAGRYPPIDSICALLGGSTRVHTVPIPIDCIDGFTEAFYARPERLLDPTVRSAQSAWHFIAPEAQERAIERLRADLASGEWDRRFGMLRAQPEFEGSLRMIVSQPTL
jgi:hypothetical protein